MAAIYIGNDCDLGVELIILIAYEVKINHKLKGKHKVQEVNEINKT